LQAQRPEFKPQYHKTKQKSDKINTAATSHAFSERSQKKKGEMI
jgi:hypothetical protein